MIIHEGQEVKIYPAWLELLTEPSNKDAWQTKPHLIDHQDQSQSASIQQLVIKYKNHVYRPVDSGAEMLASTS